MEQKKPDNGPMPLSYGGMERLTDLNIICREFYFVRTSRKLFEQIHNKDSPS